MKVDQPGFFRAGTITHGKKQEIETREKNTTISKHPKMVGAHWSSQTHAGKIMKMCFFHLCTSVVQVKFSLQVPTTPL